MRGGRLVLRLLHFSCPRGHLWEVEVCAILQHRSCLESRPICASRMLSESTDGLDLADELPPAPSRSIGAVSDVHVCARFSAEWALDRVSVDPPLIAGFEILGELGRGGMRGRLSREANEPRP